MKITIENTSSPGASFTPNTNEVLLKTYQWIKEHPGVHCTYHEFRMSLQRDKGVNDNNNRNIHPLLKNCGFVYYETRGSISVDQFFTRTGLAYIKTLETLQLVDDNSDYTPTQRREAKQKLESIQKDLVYKALTALFKEQDLNYIEPLKEFLSFALFFGKISKPEFAYYLYAKKQGIDITNLANIQDTISSYRDGLIEFEVDVSVRNDIDLRERSRTERRKEGLSYLTSFTYFSSLMIQSGIMTKDSDYYVISEAMRNRANTLLEVE